jgi:hypothetical protein
LVKRARIIYNEFLSLFSIEVQRPCPLNSKGRPERASVWGMLTFTYIQSLLTA